MNCKDCSFFVEVLQENKAEHQQGVCTFGESWTPVNMSEINECMYAPIISDKMDEKFHCEDCSHFKFDPGCLTCTEKTSIRFESSNGKSYICSGFTPEKDAEVLFPILMKWTQKGLSLKEIQNILNQLATDVSTQTKRLEKRFTNEK